MISIRGGMVLGLTSPPTHPTNKPGGQPTPLVLAKSLGRADARIPGVYCHTEDEEAQGLVDQITR